MCKLGGWGLRHDLESDPSFGVSADDPKQVETFVCCATGWRTKFLRCQGFLVCQLLLGISLLVPGSREPVSWGISPPRTGSSRQ